MAHNGDVCPHLHERLTSHIIAPFFSEPLIVSHFLSHYQFVKLGFYSYCCCCKKRVFVHLHWALMSLDLICCTQTHNTRTNVHEQLNTTPLPLKQPASVSVQFVGRYKKTHSRLRRNKVKNNIYIYFYWDALNGKRVDELLLYVSHLSIMQEVV